MSDALRRSKDPTLEKWFDAAKMGDLDLIQEMLDSGMNINTGDRIKTTALLFAAGLGHNNLVRFLLDRGADSSIENTIGHTAVTRALIRSRSWEQCFRVQDPDPTTLEILLAAGGRYRLLEAVLLNDVELARQRLAEGADPNTGEWSYFGPVLKIACEMGYVAMVRLLLDRGANIEATDDLGQRPLLSAASYGQAEVVRVLLERGAELDAVDWSGQSALANAAIEDHHEIVDFLMSRGAKRGLVDALVLNDVTIFQTLLDQAIRDGRDINRIDHGHCRLTLLASRRGNLAILRLLLDRGAKHLVEKYGDHSLLAEAAIHGQVEAARYLIERGADLHAVGQDELTPLAWAIREGQEEAAAMLRRAGAER